LVVNCFGQQTFRNARLTSAAHAGKCEDGQHCFNLLAEVAALFDLTVFSAVFQTIDGATITVLALN